MPADDQICEAAQLYSSKCVLETELDLLSGEWGAQQHTGPCDLPTQSDPTM